MGSSAFSLDTKDLVAIAKGAGLAALGAVAAYLATAGTTLDQSTAQGVILAAVLSTAANALRKWAFPQA